MQITKIGIIGCGTMGNGIVQTFATNGFDVIVHDIDQKYIDKGIESITKSLSKFVSKEKISLSDKDKALSLIQTTTDMDDLSNCDLVIEAATENEKVLPESRGFFKKMKKYFE